MYVFVYRWSKIAKHLPGRTDNEIKNFWRTKIQRQMKVTSSSENMKKIYHCSGNSQNSEMTTTDQGSSSKAFDMAESFSPTSFQVMEQSNDNYWNVEDLWPVQLLNGGDHQVIWFIKLYLFLYNLLLIYLNALATRLIHIYIVKSYTTVLYTYPRSKFCMVSCLNWLSIAKMLLIHLHIIKRCACNHVIFKTCGGGVGRVSILLRVLLETSRVKLFNGRVEWLDTLLNLGLWEL